MLAECFQGVQWWEQVMQLCKSVHQMLPTSCRYTVSATLRIGCDWQVGSSVMGRLSFMELQLGYVVLQVALLTHLDACHRHEGPALEQWVTR